MANAKTSLQGSTRSAFRGRLGTRGRFGLLSNPMAVPYLALDTFARLAGTSIGAAPMDIGGTWTVSSGSFLINTPNGTALLSGSAISIAFLDVAAADVIVSVDVSSSVATGGEAALIVRYVDDDNFVYVEIDFVNSLFRIVERIATVETQVASQSFAAAANTFYSLRVTCIGYLIIATLNGTNRIFYSNLSNITATSVGIRGHDASGSVNVLYQKFQCLAAGPAIAQDAFVDTNGTSLANHVMNIGSGWTVNTGLFTVEANAASTPSGPGLATMNPGGNGNLIVTAVLNSTIDTGGEGVVLRYTDSNNCWIQWLDYNQSTLDLYEVNLAVATVRATIPFDPAGDTFYRVMVQAEGPVIEIYLDEGNFISYQQATLNQTTTRCGIRGFRTAGSTHRFDNFQVTQI